MLRVVQTSVPSTVFVHPVFGTKTTYSVGDLVLVFQGEDAVYKITKILEEDLTPLNSSDVVATELSGKGTIVHVESIAGPDRWHEGNPLYLQLRHYEGPDPR